MTTPAIGSGADSDAYPNDAELWIQTLDHGRSRFSDAASWGSALHEEGEPWPGGEPPPGEEYWYPESLAARLSAARARTDPTDVTVEPCQDTASGPASKPGALVDGDASGASVCDETLAASAEPVASRTAIDLDALFAEPERPRLRVSVGAAVVLALVAAAVVVLVIALQPRAAEGVPALAEPTLQATTAPEVSEPAAPAVFVHVLGQVASPGVYELPSGSRVTDAVARAGGLTDSADATAINLARHLVDGEQLYVPAHGEDPPPHLQAAPEPDTNAPGSPADAGGLVNVNTADAAQLETLPRIGPAMAQRIIDHRTANGPFAAVDDLADVPGIGDATLDGLRDLVTV